MTKICSNDIRSEMVQFIFTKVREKVTVLWDVATGCTLCSYSYSDIFHRISPFEDSRNKGMMYLEGLCVMILAVAV